LTVVANVKGSELPNESLVFSAHIQEPGANDNASGVGAQLEMASITAKLLKEGAIDPRRTLTYLWGDEIISTHRYIQEKEKREAEISWGISLDMVGEDTEKTGGSFLIEKMPDPSAIWTRGNDKHSEWGGSPLEKKDMKPHYFNDFIMNMFKKQGHYANWEVNNNPFEGGSDHTPFLRADIPGLLLWHFTDQFYHTDNDRIDKVSQATLTNVGTGALASALVLINGDEETAIAMTKLVQDAALTRLTIEFDLGKSLIQEGKSTKEKEIDIIETWANYYTESVKKVTDLGTSKKVEDAIQRASEKISTYSTRLFEQLK
jgi:aminopeptidase YwaD